MSDMHQEVSSINEVDVWNAEMDLISLIGIHDELIGYNDRHIAAIKDAVGPRQSANPWT